MVQSEQNFTVTSASSSGHALIFFKIHRSKLSRYRFARICRSPPHQTNIQNNKGTFLPYAS